MKHIIEFRNGSFFKSLSHDTGVEKKDAKQFPSKKTANDFMKKHQWILFNGGMVLPV